MSNSSLVDYTELSPNNSGRRNHAIDTITIHCMAGNLSVESCGHMFASRDAAASSNYGIGSDGRIGLYVEEDNRSWCTSSGSNDNRAVTIEVANTTRKEPFPVSDEAYAALLNLVTDICRRNGINRLLWKADKSLIGNVSEQNMTVHRWFANKSCPGEWLYSRHGEIAEEVNKRLNAGEGLEMDIEEAKAKLTSCADTGDSPDEWAREATEYCKRKGIFNGDGAGNFGWKQPITREAVAQIIYNVLSAAGALDNISDK
jgi:hypothetical protein